MNSLPPLNALRAFESAARHLSFSKAAIELNVTTGAVSQQVKSLESYLELVLFVRTNRHISLTDAGEAFLAPLSLAFQQMNSAVEVVRNYGKDQPLTITGAPSFMAKWLIPKLDDFYRQYPNISVRIDATARLVDYDAENIDLGIRFSCADDIDTQLDNTYFMSQDAVAVCSPDLLKSSEHKLEKVADLQYFTLLHYESVINKDKQWIDWPSWLAALAVDMPASKGGMYFNQLPILIEAAIEGQGIALVSNVLAQKDIDKGRLVSLF